MINQMWVVLCNVVVVLGLFARVNFACQGGRLLKTGVTEQEKYDILDSHNRLRQSVAQGNVHGQPGAEDMMEMKWDTELASKAQQWANQCIFEHDQSRYLGRFIMGQNLAIMWSTEPLGEDEGDFPSRIQNWFNEVTLYAFGSPYSSKTGHYSQLIWGQSNLVGCGFSYYYDGYKYSKLWVCNYGPGGNVVGEDPYTTGRPSCQNHGLSTSSRYPGLCNNGFGGQSYPSTEQISNVIPDTGFNYKNAFDDSINKYKQYQETTGTGYNVPTKVQNILPLSAVADNKPYKNKNNDYTFSSFGFNSWNKVPEVSAAPAYAYQTTQKPLLGTQAPKQHSAFYTYNWDSLFNNYYSYNNVRK